MFPYNCIPISFSLLFVFCFPCVRHHEQLVLFLSIFFNIISLITYNKKIRAMAQTSCELMWIKHLLEELKFVVKVSMTMHCDNQATIHIASNPMFHEST